jgi:hypothetical protein
MTYFDSYDNRIYAMGKGPSATTVDAPMTSVTAGSSVVIRGTVTDQSPDTKDYKLTARFPSGVPAVSDESMSDWMLYVYKQFPRPDATGVEVTIDAIDPNNNFISIGKATTDSSGSFSYMWKTPEVPGKYTIIVTFAGSNSYWSSFAETAMGVDEAPTTPEPQPEPVSNTDAYVAYSAVGIIVAIAVVGVILALLVRKRP